MVNMKQEYTMFPFNPKLMAIDEREIRTVGVSRVGWGPPDKKHSKIITDRTM